MKIFAIVVTYNRIKYLQKCVNSLRNQTIPLSKIIVINNSSTDGTAEWLLSQSDIETLTQPNVGGAGGFYRGIKEAYNQGADYIWAMDDDVNPSESCLKSMYEVFSHDKSVGIVVPKRVMDGNSVSGEVESFNLSNPFAPLKRSFSPNKYIHEEVVDIEGMSFEGPLISRQVVSKIGFPNRNLFIFWDDTDYSYRAVLAGFKVKYSFEAIMNKENLKKSNAFVDTYRSWKEPYALRNNIYFCRKYGKNCFFKTVMPLFILIRYILGWIKHIIKRDGYYKLSDLYMVITSFCNGYRCRL